MMMPTDWLSDIKPALTNPTTSTVVTDDDWMTAVTIAPVVAAVNRLVVSRARRRFIPSPAAAFMPSAIRFMP